MSTDETRRLLALLDTGEPAAILDNAEAIADELRWLASKWEAVDRENTALGTAYADVREAADTLRRALSETMVRTVHYDWNADPDSITRLQGDAVALLERCTRSRDVLTSQQREAVLITERNQLRRYRDGWKREATRYRKQARYWNERHWTLLQKHHDERTDARQEVLTAHQERDRAVASVAALLHAYIGITPGTTVDGLTPEVQAEAERLLEERLALEAERDDLRDECQALRAALASVGVRDA